MKKRGFEIVKGYEDKGINLPVRKTKNSAAYDVEAAENILIPKYYPGIKPTLIPTGLKVIMNEDEMLMIIVRSGVGFKYNVRLTNQVGIIESDYYNNISNEGHMWISVQNHSDKELKFEKGDSLCQGIFVKFLTVDDEKVIDNKRLGGLGSTGK